MRSRPRIRWILDHLRTQARRLDEALAAAFVGAFVDFTDAELDEYLAHLA